MQRLQRVRQGPTQNVEQVADEIRALCGQGVSDFRSPDEKLLSSRALRPSLRQLVATHLCPLNLAAAKEVAKTLEQFVSHVRTIVQTRLWTNRSRRARPPSNRTAGDSFGARRRARCQQQTDVRRGTRSMRSPTVWTNYDSSLPN